MSETLGEFRAKIKAVEEHLELAERWGELRPLESLYRKKEEPKVVEPTFHFVAF